MRRHNERLYRSLRTILSDPQDIEDAMQDAYVIAFTHLERLESPSSFPAWLVRIARNLALRKRRQARWLVPADPSGDACSAHAPEERASLGQSIGILEAAVDSLPEPYRTVLVLRGVQGLSTQETAATLELSDDVVKVRLHRARTLLRQEIISRIDAEAARLFPFHAPRCNRVVTGVFDQLLRTGAIERAGVAERF